VYVRVVSIFREDIYIHVTSVSKFQPPGTTCICTSTIHSIYVLQIYVNICTYFSPVSAIVQKVHLLL
jgi:hypothetical protein